MFVCGVALFGFAFRTLYSAPGGASSWAETATCSTLSKILYEIGNII